MTQCSYVHCALRHRHAFGLILTMLLLTLSACAGQLPPVAPISTAEVPQSSTPTGGTDVPAPAPTEGILALPAAFRYEVTLRPVQADAPATVIAGQYRNGEWAQTSRTGEQGGEELVVALDPASGQWRSYTRAVGDADWTRWPGVTFDAGYGLASPFTALRLRPVASEAASADPASDGASVPPFAEAKTQTLISAEGVQRVLMAGVEATTADADTRAALEQQLAALFVPQTITYWTDASGRVVRATATLLSRSPDREPGPWIEFTANYSSYDDPAIVVAAPASATDIADVAGRDAVIEQAADVAPGVNLRVRVFATAGVPAGDSIVTAYPAGKNAAVDEKLGPDAQFTLKAGVYDLLVRSAGAEQWLKGVTVTEGAVTSNDVLFEFTQLTVTVTLGGTTPAVDVVVFPPGETTNFAGFASNNPARFQLPAGEYDVEAATQDGAARKRVSGVVVRGGLETTLTLDLAQP